MQIPKELVEAFKKKDIKFLASYLFPNIKAAQNLSYYQCYIVRRIAFSEVRRLSLSAYTRYGKTQCVAIAVAIYIIINERKKIKFIGPTDDQAGIIRDYMSELIVDCEILADLVDLEASGIDRLKKEMSRKRLTFKNGCEYRIVSAFGKGFAAMGHGGDLIIMDEAALISREAYTKIVRMLGDDPENSVLVELFNPFDRNTKAFDHSISPRFERIQISWRVGLKEGRTTKAHIVEMAEELGGYDHTDFIVLYESRFPDEAEDSLHSLRKVEAAENIRFNLNDKLEEIIAKLRHPEKHKESEIVELREEVKKYIRIISCDPADMGTNETVIKWGVKYGNRFEPMGMYAEPKSDPMILVGKIMNIARDFIGLNFKVKGLIKIDIIGIGTGPVSRCKEIIRDWKMDNVRVIGCHNGKAADKKDEFKNKKSENNHRLKELFNDSLIALGIIKEHKLYHKLKTQVLAMRWKYTSSSKKIIIDPKKSPDYNDALVYFVWEDKTSLSWGFI